MRLAVLFVLALAACSGDPDQALVSPDHGGPQPRSCKTFATVPPRVTGEARPGPAS